MSREGNVLDSVLAMSAVVVFRRLVCHSTQLTEYISTRRIALRVRTTNTVKHGFAQFL